MVHATQSLCWHAVNRNANKALDQEIQRRFRRYQTKQGQVYVKAVDTSSEFHIKHTYPNQRTSGSQISTKRLSKYVHKPLPSRTTPSPPARTPPPPPGRRRVLIPLSHLQRRHRPLLPRHSAHRLRQRNPHILLRRPRRSEHRPPLPEPKTHKISLLPLRHARSSRPHLR